jgi:hypothetical protein
VAAVKLSGLAIAIADGNSCIALVSFTWGIFFFREAIHSKAMACVGVCMMILGFSGMSYYSTRESKKGKEQQQQQQQQLHTTSSKEQGAISRQLPTHTNSGLSKVSLTSSTSSTSPESGNSVDLIEEARMGAFRDTTKESLKSSNHHHAQNDNTRHDNSNRSNDEEEEGGAASESSENRSANVLGGGLRHRQAHHLQHHANESTPAHKSLSSAATSSSSSPIIPLTHKHYDHLDESTSASSFISWVPQSATPQPTDVLLTAGDWNVTRRQAGIALSVCNGCWGGSVMVPMKFCPDKSITSGIGYVWSFSIGALVVNAGLWIFRYLWLLVDTKSLPQAYRALPSFHIKQMWRPGGLAGLLWSIGNLFSILSVDYLGEGVGYCVCQAGMFVSGLWGIFYFHEVQGTALIARWFLSAMVTISGILLLSYEHHET